MEKLFPGDVLSKRERVIRTLNHQPVDRAVLHDQLSYNSGVIARYTGKQIEDFTYTIEDICQASRKTLDLCFPPFAPVGTERVVGEDGFTKQNDNWTTWFVSKPFSDEKGAAEWVRKRVRKLRQEIKDFDTDACRNEYRDQIERWQPYLGETILFDWSTTGFCQLFYELGLELYSYVTADHQELLGEYMELSIELELKRVEAVAPVNPAPLILIPEDFSSKTGPIFPPAFLHRFHYPYVNRLAQAWHDRGFKVIYHSDGNFKAAVPDLIECGIDGFYCLEPGCGMDIVELKQRWPDRIWAGGIDGVDLMERGTPEQVYNDVQRIISATGVLERGGIFMGTSSEINLPISADNFTAMVTAVSEMRNPAVESV